MTEQEWLDSGSPWAMLNCVDVTFSERRLRLFGSACCRRALVIRSWEMTDAALTQLAIAESFADGSASDNALLTEHYVANQRVQKARARNNPREIALAEAVASITLPPTEAESSWAAAAGAAHEGCNHAGNLIAYLTTAYSFNVYSPNFQSSYNEAENVDGGGAFTDPAEDDWHRAKMREIPIQAALLRHIIGNPFKPYPASASWPSTITALAQAMYDGDGNRLVLADALEETGFLELADHFRKEEWHPKGCWVVDLLLNKK